MNKSIITLSSVAALAFSLNAEVVAQDGDHLMHQATDMTHDPVQVTMDHDAMNHEEMNHEEMNHEEMNHDAMDHSDMAEMDTALLRDPHAYSGGFERGSGPYALPSQRRVVLADEATFVGVWMDRFEFVDHQDKEGVSWRVLLGLVIATAASYCKPRSRWLKVRWRKVR
ncbi:MAG: hypothetical protein JKY86_14130 [Gammaproteobacteria bacterium]|nr:hypothetical protein [Gammaproteobacteria bacterium]